MTRAEQEFDDEFDEFDYDTYVPNKPKCNEHLVRDLMNYNNTGAMCQMMIMTAIQEYAQKIAKTPAVDDGKSMINAVAWKRCAEEIVEKCEAFYGRHG